MPYILRNHMMSNNSKPIRPISFYFFEDEDGEQYGVSLSYFLLESLIFNPTCEKKRYIQTHKTTPQLR